MKVSTVETVTRYRVWFTPGEIRKLLEPEDTRHWLFVTRTARGNVQAHAQLTKSQINRVCDVLGVNGREWMERHLPNAKESQ